MRIIVPSIDEWNRLVSTQSVPKYYSSILSYSSEETDAIDIGDLFKLLISKDELRLAGCRYKKLNGHVYIDTFHSRVLYTLNSLSETELVLLSKNFPEIMFNVEKIQAFVRSSTSEITKVKYFSLIPLRYDANPQHIYPDAIGMPHLVSPNHRLEIYSNYMNDVYDFARFVKNKNYKQLLNLFLLDPDFIKKNQEPFAKILSDNLLKIEDYLWLCDAFGLRFEFCTVKKMRYVLNNGEFLEIPFLKEADDYSDYSHSVYDICTQYVLRKISKHKNNPKTIYYTRLEIL